MAATTQSMYRAGNRTTGRHIAHILCMRPRTNDEMAMVYSVTDLCSVTWQGDAPEQATRLRDRWEKILDNLSTKLDDETLRDLLLEQMEKSQVFGRR